MLWLILSLISAAIYSLCGFIDNYITDVIFRNNRSESVKGFYGPTYIISGIVVACIFGLNGIDLKAIGLVSLSSAIISLASIPYYRALKNEDATGAAVYYQLSPLFYLLLDIFILNKQITVMNMIGFIVILLAPIVIVMSRKRARSRKLALSSAILFILYVVIASTGGSLFAAVANSGYNIMSIFSIALTSRGIFDLILFIANKKWHHRCKNVWQSHAKAILTATLVNQALFIAAEFCYRYGYTLTNTSTVSVVVNASELIMTFIFGIILSIIWPNFGREKIRRHEVVAHLFAVLLATVGIILIN